MKHKHHIKPKHEGGTDDPENLIELSIEEHVEIHRLLYEENGKIQDFLAWKGLAGLMTKEEIVKSLLSYAGKKGGSSGKGVTGKRANGAIANWEKNKDKLLEVLRENGKKYGHLGGPKRDWIWIHNEKENKKILASEEIPKGWQLGRLPMSDETKRKIKSSCAGINKGVKRSDEQKEALSKFRKGKKWYHSPDGKTGMFKENEKPLGWLAGRNIK
jgi:hypothetical protein